MSHCVSPCGTSHWADPPSRCAPWYPYHPRCMGLGSSTDAEQRGGATPRRCPFEWLGIWLFYRRKTSPAQLRFIDNLPLAMAHSSVELVALVWYSEMLSSVRCILAIAASTIHELSATLCGCGRHWRCHYLGPKLRIRRRRAGLQ